MNSDKSIEIIKIYNQVQIRILLFAETSLPEHNFQAFRKLVIQEFGHGGAKDKVMSLFSKNRNVTD